MIAARLGRRSSQVVLCSGGECIVRTALYSMRTLCRPHMCHGRRFSVQQQPKIGGRQAAVTLLVGILASNWQPCWRSVMHGTGAIRELIKAFKVAAHTSR